MVLVFSHWELQRTVPRAGKLGLLHGSMYLPILTMTQQDAPPESNRDEKNPHCTLLGVLPSLLPCRRHCRGTAWRLLKMPGILPVSAGGTPNYQLMFSLNPL